MIEARRRGLALSLLPGTIVASACLAAAAGTVAGGGVYFTTRGAEKVVRGSAEEVAGAVSPAFEALGVEHRGQREEDDRLEVYGRRREDEVTVELRPETDRATRVEVRVRTSAVTWDKEFARRILEEIDSLRR